MKPGKQSGNILNVVQGHGRNNAVKPLVQGFPGQIHFPDVQFTGKLPPFAFELGVHGRGNIHRGDTLHQRRNPLQQQARSRTEIENVHPGQESDPALDGVGDPVHVVDPALRLIVIAGLVPEVVFLHVFSRSGENRGK